MNSPDPTPTYLTICRNVRADAFILGIQPEDESEQAIQRGRELIAKHCKEHRVDEFAFTAWLFN
jgi:hypothetical protein